MQEKNKMRNPDNNCALAVGGTGQRFPEEVPLKDETDRIPYLSESLERLKQSLRRQGLV